jgi:cell division protein FtsB
MGIFGFLSRAHIEQSLAINTGALEQIAIIDEKIALERSSIADIDKQIAQIDNAVNKMTERNQAQSSLRAAEQQRKTRTDLVKQREQKTQAVAQLSTERIKLTSEVKKLEAEVGPIKYIAEMVYGTNSDKDILEHAVRWVIILLIFVFDPLAVLLLIAANQGISHNKQLKNIRESHIITVSEIDANNVLRIND